MNSYLQIDSLVVKVVEVGGLNCKMKLYEVLLIMVLLIMVLLVMVLLIMVLLIILFLLLVLLIFGTSYCEKRLLFGVYLYLRYCYWCY